MLWKLPGRAVMLSVEFATPGVLGQHGSSCEISAAPPRSLEESRGMLQRWWRPLGPALCRDGMVLISVSPSRHADTTPAWFLMACAAAPWASSDGYVFKEAFILSPSLPVQVSSPCTKVDDDYEGEWCLLALPWERAWRDGSIVPGSPWLLAIPVLGELKRWVDLERRF